MEELYRVKSAYELRTIGENLCFIFQKSYNQLFMNTFYDDISFGLRSNKENEENISLKIDSISKEVQIEKLKI